MTHQPRLSLAEHLARVEVLPREFHLAFQAYPSEAYRVYGLLRMPLV